MFVRNFKFILKNTIFQHQYQKQVKFFAFISWLVSFVVCIYIQYFFDVVRNKLRTVNVFIELIKRRSKVQEKPEPYESSDLDFDQWKTFSENYKPMRVWLWLVCNFTNNYCCLQLFSEFIQTQKRYSTSLDQIHILIWKLLVILN